MSEKIKKNTYFASLGQFSQMILAFILIPFATRYLGPERFGIYALASTIMYFVFLFNDLGINTYVIREVSKDLNNAQRYYANSLFFKLIFMLFIVPVLFLFVEIVGFSSEAKVAILIFAFYGIIISVVQLNTSIFRAYEKMEFETVVIALEKLLTTGFGIFVLIQGWGLYALCAVYVLGGLSSIFVSLLLLHKYFFKIRINCELKFIRHLITRALPFGVSLFLANFYNNIAIILLSIMQTAQVVGWFSAAGRLLKFTSIVPTILSVALFPALSREVIHSKQKFAELFTKGFKYTSFLAIPLVAGILILAENIALHLFGQEYVNSIVVLKILAWAAGLIYFNVFWAALFNASNNQKKLVIIQVAATLLNLALNVLLIPRYAHVGSALAMVATEGVIFLACIVFAYQKISRLQEASFILKTLGATAVMSLISINLKSFNMAFAVILSVMVYFSVLYVFGGFSFKDVLLLRKSR